MFSTLKSEFVNLEYSEKNIYAKILTELTKAANNLKTMENDAEFFYYCILTKILARYGSIVC